MYAPGQWVNLVLPLPDEEVKRAYSIASAPTPSARFEVAVTKVSGGAGSEFLHDLPEGALLRVIGPQGLFTRDPTDVRPALFVATGTGVTPLRSMIQAARRGAVVPPMTLLFGARHEADILYREEFEAFAASAAPGAFRYEVTLSQPDASWTGRRGYVQAHVGELLGALRPAGEVQLFVCGLQRMVSTVRDLARHELGLDRKAVHSERYD